MMIGMREDISSRRMSICEQIFFCDIQDLANEEIFFSIRQFQIIIKKEDEEDFTTSLRRDTAIAPKESQ